MYERPQLTIDLLREVSRLVIVSTDKVYNCHFEITETELKTVLELFSLSRAVTSTTLLTSLCSYNNQSE